MLPADSPFAPLPAPGPHPATAELRAYAAGTLSPTDEHRIEAHALDCERCAELLEGFAMSDAATTDRAVAELRTRLQARVDVPNAAPAAPRTWPRLAAAAALVGVVAAGFWGLEQRDAEAPETAITRPQASPPAASIPPAAAPVPSAAPAAPQLETAAAAPVASPAKPSKAAYAAVSTAPARRAAARPRTSRAASPSSPETADLVASAPPEQADKLSAAQTDAKETPASVASARENAAEVIAAAPVPDASKLLKQQVGEADTAAAPPAASQRTVAKAKARVMETAQPAISAASAGRSPATIMPPALAIKPAPVGGMAALRDYIRREANEFEPEARAMRLTGYVHVKFIVGADGKPSDFKVTRGLRDDYDAEAIRIISEGPGWQPGVSGGRRAPLPMELTVPF